MLEQKFIKFKNKNFIIKIQKKNFYLLFLYNLFFKFNATEFFKYIKDPFLKFEVLISKNIEDYLMK